MKKTFIHFQCDALLLRLNYCTLLHPPGQENCCASIWPTLVLLMAERVSSSGDFTVLTITGLEMREIVAARHLHHNAAEHCISAAQNVLIHFLERQL